MKQFDFSVVMAVYNVEEFLREAVDSLIHQTIGFSRIQVILVDDGSTDKSGAICDEYKKKYSENIVVIHKENGRQASARNAGLPYVKGEYVNFLDPDDTLERHAMKRVKVFMDSHRETDICCIPMVFFGNVKGPHILNEKFKHGTRVIDLMDDNYADCMQFSVAASFYRKHIAKKMRFDTNLFHAEDAKENLRILIEKPVIGLVTDTRYNYRKYGGSTLNKSLRRKESYIPYLVHFSSWVLDTARSKYGYLPRFVQNAVMYDLQWKWNQSAVPAGLLTDEELSEYQSLIIGIVSQIDDDIIIHQKNMNVERRCLLLSKKYHEKGKTDLHVVPCNTVKNRRSVLPIKDIELYLDTCKAASVSEMDTSLEFLSFEDNRCIIEGCHQTFGLEHSEIKPVVFVNGKIVYGEVVDRPKNVFKSLGERASDAIGFKCEIALIKKPLEIILGLEVDGIVVPRLNLQFGKFFPVTDLYSNSYAITNGKYIQIKKHAIFISKIPNGLKRTKRELCLLHELWKKDITGGRKAVAGRLFYNLIMPFKRNKIWIVSDRILKADDNGEALFCYLQEHKLPRTRVYFAVQKSSSDYKRLKQIGKCINAMSYQHKLLHLISDIVVSSSAEGVTKNPFMGYDDGLRDLLLHQKFIFLQHGITQNDLTGWLNRFNQNISGFVTAAKPEWNSIVEGGYYYSKKQVWLTGFPRFDRLYRDERKIITIMPTWRRYLMDEGITNTGTWTLIKDYKQSEYYKFYNALLNSERLLSALENYGYTLHFFPHPNIQPHIKQFQQDARVKFLPINTAYRDVYAKSNLIITDYSSAVFDFAYLRKPVIYCQFDCEAFFGGEHTLARGYFDYEEDGFGEVVYNLDDTINLIIDYVKNDCQLKDKYREREDQFFAFNDQENCRRVINKITELINE